MKKLVWFILVTNIILLGILFIGSVLQTFAAPQGWSSTIYECTDYPPVGGGISYHRGECYLGGPYTSFTSWDCTLTYTREGFYF